MRQQQNQNSTTQVKQPTALGPSTILNQVVYQPVLLRRSQRNISQQQENNINANNIATSQNIIQSQNSIGSRTNTSSQLPTILTKEGGQRAKQNWGHISQEGTHSPKLQSTAGSKHEEVRDENKPAITAVGSQQQVQKEVNYQRFQNQGQELKMRPIQSHKELLIEDSITPKKQMVTEDSILGKRRSMIETTATTSRHSTSPDNLLNGGGGSAVTAEEINQNLLEQPTTPCANSIKRFKTEIVSGHPSEPQQRACTEFNVPNEEESKRGDTSMRYAAMDESSIVIPQYDPSQNYLSLYFKILTHNKQMLDVYSETLNQRNDLLRSMVAMDTIQLPPFQHLSQVYQSSLPQQLRLPTPRGDSALETKKPVTPTGAAVADMSLSTKQPMVPESITGAGNGSIQDAADGTDMLMMMMEGEDGSLASGNQWYQSGRKRHYRRCNNEIAKQYRCPYGTCTKTYGSEGSLNLHMKIKHAAGSKTDREKYARDLVIAIRSGADLTAADIEAMKTLPPGLLEECAKEIGFLHDFFTHPAFKTVRNQLKPYLVYDMQRGMPAEAEKCGFATPLPPQQQHHLLSQQPTGLQSATKQDETDTKNHRMYQQNQQH